MSKFSRMRDMVYHQIMNNEPIPQVLSKAYNKALYEIDPEAYKLDSFGNLVDVITGEIRRAWAEDYGEE